MATTILEITDVKTKADVHKIHAQQCIFSGYNAAITTLIVGAATLPYAFIKIRTPLFVIKEYKLLAGVFFSVGASYFSGIYFKNRCEKRLFKELEELNLGHLLEGIER